MDNGQRPLPYNEDCEQGVLVCFIRDPQTVGEECSRMLRPEYFHAPAHRIVYEILLQWTGEGPVEYHWMVAEAKKLGQLEEVGGRPFLDQLTQAVQVPKNVGYYIEGLRQTWQERETISICRKLTEAPEETTRRELLERLQEVNSLNGNQEWLRFESHDELPDKEPNQIILGILHAGESQPAQNGSKHGCCII
jgi:replicative DNA helicase